MIKDTLKARGSMEIRSLGRIFRALDDNRNRKVDKRELQDGLRDFQINLSDEEATVLFGIFDRDSNGQIVFDEFLRSLRGDLSEARLGWIKKAYSKLDANSDGVVKLDDVARLYDASHHPDVVERGKPVEEVYAKFMSQWDTQVADGQVTFDEFCDYYRDVSCSIDTDEYFGVMMKNAWKL